jgi:osmotically-inducible protein OsmY
VFPFWPYPDGWPYASHHSSTPEPRDAASEADLRLVRRVAAGLLGDPAVRGDHIDVTAQNRVVILQGEVDSAYARTAAGHRTWGTPGVLDVCNRLVVRTRHHEER